MSMIGNRLASVSAIDARSIGEIEREITAELQFHVEMRALENARSGMSPDVARQSALIQFGDFAKIQKECRVALLGGRIMWQRIQISVSIVLVVTVALLALQVQSGQRANQAALADITLSLERLSDEPAATLRNWRADRPVVVATFPQNGAIDVNPALSEVRVTFSKAMADRSWSWVQVSKETFPESAGDVHYIDGGTTCVMPAKLQPGKKYIIWFNSANYQNFTDTDGRPAEPYLLTFTTRQ